MELNKKNYGNIRTFAEELGVSLFGVADITEIRKEFLFHENSSTKFSFGLSLGKRLVEAVLEDIQDAPTPLYFNHYRQLNFFLDRTAFLIASRIQDLGFSALPVPASQVIDWQRQRGHLSHKKIGEMAGLGWIGRNNLLVSPSFGARIRLVTVLTDMPLDAGQPLEPGCGACRRCLASCPAQAIKERREDFDHLACFEKLKEFRNKGLVSQFICGVCVKACPGNFPK